MKKKFKVDNYVIYEKGKCYEVLVFPASKYMWAYDDYPEENFLAVDGDAKTYMCLKYALSVLIHSSKKIIYFPCRNEGVGENYCPNYDLVLCTPAAQLRRSSWVRIRRKINPRSWIGKYNIQYDRRKLEDYYMKKCIDTTQDDKYYRYPIERTEVKKAIEKNHVEKILDSTLFMVMGEAECYRNHYQIAADLDRYAAGEDYGCWTAMGWILPEKTIADMYKGK